MYKRSIVVLGIILGSYAPGAAQTTGPKLILARNEVAEIAPRARDNVPADDNIRTHDNGCDDGNGHDDNNVRADDNICTHDNCCDDGTVWADDNVPAGDDNIHTDDNGCAPTTTSATTTTTATTKTFRMVSTPFLSASFLVYQAPDKSTPQFIFLSGAAYEHDPGLESLASLSPMHEVRTTFLTLSSLPLAQLWSGRLRLDGFTSTIHMREVELGPSVASGLEDFRRPRQSDPSGLRSFDVYGVSLSLHFGRGARTAHPVQGWRTLSRLAGSVLQ